MSPAPPEAGMRIAELGRTCGVSTPTIKYYIREGLLPAGRLTSSNQARYTEEHVHRLRLIRALLELGGLSVAKVRAIVTVLDGETDPSPRGRPAAGLDALEALTAPAPQDGPLAILAADPRTLALVHALAERRGWHTPADGPEFARVVEILHTLGELDQHHFADRIDAYADAAERAAAADTQLLHSPIDGTGPAERLVVAAVLGDQLLSALRRLARTAGTTGTAACCTAPDPKTEKGREPHTGCSPLPHVPVGARYERLTSSRSRTGSAS
ncbi:MerR family transcriptional regulator [Streptomyces zaomyceticus]|uniref:MerR family transcriptional regulator n=1 Tax=Streptomyces zaomyceticus TaxID=68286 RepID=UPI002F918C70